MTEKPAVAFAALGIPFPLFEAPANLASEYEGVGPCSLCGQGDRHRFQLGIGADVTADCPSCGLANGLDADDKEAAPCRRCGFLLPFPVRQEGDGPLTACYECLRAGRAALTKDTEWGMVTWEQAQDGVTHGTPVPPPPAAGGFETVAVADGWQGARINPADMTELLRTPAYVTWQGERWLFCCRRPMVYGGEWLREDFARNTPPAADPEAFFNVVMGNDENAAALWDEGWGGGSVVVYVFRCAHCRGFRGHWDLD